ncbi:hypothetical protein [Rhizobium chutanense]|uniref:hypothetical protein n=1 Tax=Rhizobium chutanense TaxID=2035448 RepID=UPI000F898524|nr:hypothetical protein [Rhizobium chutanense]
MDAKADRLRPDCARLAGDLHRTRRNHGKADGYLNSTAGPTGRRHSGNHPRSSSGLAFLPVFVGFEMLFPFVELRPKKYQLSSRILTF